MRSNKSGFLQWNPICLCLQTNIQRFNSRHYRANNNPFYVHTCSFLMVFSQYILSIYRDECHNRYHRARALRRCDFDPLTKWRWSWWSFTIAILLASRDWLREFSISPNTSTKVSEPLIVFVDRLKSRMYSYTRAIIQNSSNYAWHSIKKQ